MKDKKGNVYVFENDFGVYKIGITRGDVNFRLGAVECASGVPSKVVCHFTADNPEAIEKILHSYHREFKVIGEWFWKLDFEFIDRVKNGTVDLSPYEDILNIDEALKLELDKVDNVTWREIMDIKKSIHSKATPTDVSETVKTSGLIKKYCKGPNRWVRKPSKTP